VWTFIKDTGLQIGGKIISISIALVTTAVLTRKLGSQTYGNFSLIGSILLLVDAIADLGTRTIGVREASKKEASKVFINIFYLRTFLSLIAFIVGLFLVVFYGAFEGVRLEALISLLMLYLTSWAGNLEIVLQTKLRFDWKTIVDILFPLFFLISLFLGGGSSLKIIFVYYLIARLLSLIIGWWKVRKWVDWKQKFDKKLLIKLLRESWPMGLFLIVSASYDKAIDSTMIRHFLGVEQVAWYALAYKVYGSLVMPAYFLMTSVFPVLSRKNNRYQKVYKQALLILLLMLVVGVPLIYYLAPIAIDILGGSDFGASIRVLRILILALVISYINHLNGFGLISRGKQRQMLKISVMALVVNMALNWWTIPLLGIDGAGWTTVATEAFSGVLMWKAGRS